MNTIREWISTIADIGVVVGFVMIALQLQQNRVAIELQTNAELSNSYLMAESAMMGENPAAAYQKSIFEPESLTREEVIQITAYLNTNFQWLTVAQLAVDSGAMTEDRLQELVAIFTPYLHYPFGRLWWSYNSNWYDPRLVSAVNAEMARARNPDEMLTYSAALWEDLQKLREDAEK